MQAFAMTTSELPTAVKAHIVTVNQPITAPTNN